MTERTAIVTGSNGRIGSAIARMLGKNGWHVVGVDRLGAQNDACDTVVPFDLSHCQQQDRFEQDCLAELRRAAGDNPISALVNNAAVQILDRTADIELADWQETLNVNLTAPMLLSQALLPELRDNHGHILNIGSVHAQATKKQFVAYATSKAALHGLTRALAVDLGGEVQVNCLAPAAIDTEMLRAGFVGKPNARKELESCHPAGCIGTDREVAKAALMLLSDDMPFLTGSCFHLDGGILSRLHDPA